MPQRPTLERTATFLALLLLTITSNAHAQPTDQLPPVADGKLTVATRHVPPFAIRDDNGSWSGIAINLVAPIVADLTDATGEPIEVEYREMSLAEMLEAVAADDVDLAVAALTVNYEREQVLDFSHPFHRSGLGIAVSAEQSSGWFSVLERIFSITFLEVLGGLFVMLLISGLLIYLFERRANKEQFGGGFWRGLGAGLWWSIVTLTTVGYGDKAPATVGGRAVAIVWMFTSLLTISAFMAAMTSALTVGQMQSKVSGPEDLPRVRVATVSASTSESYLRSRGIRPRTYDELSGALAELEAGNVDAVVYDAPILRYQVLEGDPGIHVLPSTFQQQDYAIAMPPGSPLRETVNRAVVREINKGAWEEKLRGYLGEM